MERGPRARRPSRTRAQNTVHTRDESRQLWRTARVVDGLYRAFLLQCVLRTRSYMLHALGHQEKCQSGRYAVSGMYTEVI
jgi:hypothetical protein